MRSILSGALGPWMSLLFGACGSATGLTAASSGPSIAITSPANNATVVANDANPNAPISFTVSNFTLMAPGTCGDIPACGHVELFVDGTACNNSAPHPYNNSGATSPMTADLAYCPTLNATHTVTLELHFDDLTPVTDAFGNRVSASIGITAVAQLAKGRSASSTTKVSSSSSIASGARTWLDAGARQAQSRRHGGVLSSGLLTPERKVAHLLVRRGN